MKKLIFLTAILSFLISAGVWAQNESGSRYLNQPIFEKTKLWFNESNSMYQSQFPIIRSIPPLSTGMPYEIMLSYIYLDSLLRFGTEHETDIMLDSWNSLNDTMKYTCKFLYMMNDYNPIIFNQYIGEVDLHREIDYSIRDSSYDRYDSGQKSYGVYKNSLLKLRYNLCEKFRELVSSDNNALFSLLHADYILKVHITDIDSMRNKYSPFDESTPDYRYNILARIDTIFKGQVVKLLPENTIFPNLKKIISNSVGYMNFTSSSFLYSSLWSSEGSMYQYPDTNFLRSDGLFYLKEGQDIIVFMQFGNQKFDCEYDYFEIFPCQSCSLNALPIIDGNVHDVNRVWSESGILSYDEWVNKFNTLKMKILNISY